MTKKALVITIAVLMALLTACGTMPAEEKESSTATQTVSFPAGNETESKAEPSEAEVKKQEPQKTKPEDTVSSKAETEAGENVLPTEKPKEPTPQPTEPPKSEPPKSEPEQSQPPKPEPPETEPKPTQLPAEKPKAEEPTPQPTKEPEPEPTPTPEPEKPKSIYDYEFDVGAIQQELMAIGTGMGLQIDSTLTPDSSSWGNPVTAFQGFQGAALERSLKDYVRSMPDIITAYGGQPIQYFTIYVESLGGGSYRFYFLY